MTSTEAPLRVQGTELEVALGEVEAVLAMVPDGEYRSRLEELRGQLAGEGPSDAGIDELDRLLGLALQSGPATCRLRARRRERRDPALPQAPDGDGRSARAPPR